MDRLLGGPVEHHGDAHFLLLVWREFARLQSDEQHKQDGKVRPSRDNCTATQRRVGAAEPAHSGIGGVQNALQHALRLTRLSGPRRLASPVAALAARPAAQPW